MTTPQLAQAINTALQRIITDTQGITDDKKLLGWTVAMLVQNGSRTEFDTITLPAAMKEKNHD